MKIICKKILTSKDLPFNFQSKKVIFLRIDPGDKRETLQQIYQRLSDKSWISRFNKSYIRACYNKRVDETINNLCNKLKLGDNDTLTKDAGEYFVSELSRQAIVNGLNYSNIPLAELRKEQKSGNPGFDFHSENDEQIIIFGEAKYLSKTNAYGSALSQIVDFIKDGKDLNELRDLEDFVSTEAMNHFENGYKGFAAAFSSHLISNEDLIKHIFKNKNFKELLNYEELLLVAVDVNE